MKRFSVKIEENLVEHTHQFLFWLSALGLWGGPHPTVRLLGLTRAGCLHYLLFSCNCFRPAWWLHLFKDDSMRILLLEAGDERSAINILAEPQIPGLDNAGNEYHEDVSNLGKQRLSGYPNNPAARKAMSAQAKCRKAR